MEARCLDFTVYSASNLVDVRKYGEMKVYAKVSVEGKSQCTEADVKKETNPEWNTTFRFIVPEENIIRAEGKISIKIELFCKRSLSNDKYIGEVNLSLDSQCAKSCNTCLVDRNGTNYKSSNFGTLRYSSVLGDKFILADSSSSSSSSSSSQDYVNKINIASIGATILSTVVTVAVAATEI
ncbi:putative cytochrome 93A1-like [Capsicum annuum]|uniref:C2 domain-containing protein n=1 Tax=Capsicum annuum TaxID=4072 RepID=A0A1U8HE01_CAPAN|nr:uncharacterized protein LOC107878998 [Capsicum annuum]KAF3623033.1 putative cytochrome 93A1-like [Capsicum annuum]KAF3675695.1 putative cytochrome 93A1-like [Capsicum annuum]PHT74022.1 hypothetical protein T459_21299 [Capsicum annuum]